MTQHTPQQPPKTNVDIHYDSNPPYLCFTSLEIAGFRTLRFLIQRRQGCSMSVSVTPSLCDRCSSMFQGSVLRRPLHHHTSIQILEQEANKNCIICRDVWKNLVKRPDFDRETCHGDTTKEGYVTSHVMFKDSIHVSLVGRQLKLHLHFRYVETQRKSAFRPSRV